MLHNHTPYHYCLDNPVKSIDVNGDTVVVLQDVNGAHGFGHMAILIQGKDGVYQLYSKNGTNESSGTKGPEDKAGGDDVGTGKSYKSPAEFMTSDKNAPDKKTGEREYAEGFVIPTTKAEDKKAIAGAKEELKKDYNVAGSNCATTVQKALDRAGKSDGSPSLVENAILHAISPAIGTAANSGVRRPRFRRKVGQSFVEKVKYIFYLFKFSFQFHIYLPITQ